MFCNGADLRALTKVEYPELIKGVDSIERVRKYIVDAMNAIQDKVDEFSEGLTNKLGEALGKAGISFKEEHQISIPKVDLKALEEKSKKTAFKEEGVYENYYERRWYTLWLKDYKERRQVGTKKVFDSEKFLGEYKTSCNEEFYKIVNDLPGKSKTVLDTYLQYFTTEMNSVIEERQRALEQEKNNKRTNEDITNKIKELDRKKKDIQPEIKRCDEVLEDMQ